MHTLLGTMAIVLAVAFTAGGLTLILLPQERYRDLHVSQHWAEDYTPGQLKAIGTVKTTGALGLVLPAVLVPLAASGLMLFMAGPARRGSAGGSTPSSSVTCSSSRPSRSSRGGGLRSSRLVGEKVT